MNKYDLIVIGAGVGGIETAIRAAEIGLKVGICGAGSHRRHVVNAWLYTKKNHDICIFIQQSHG